jgi:hypothetical protein
MNDSKQLAINFLEKEIKTYKTLSLFLAKESRNICALERAES